MFFKGVLLDGGYVLRELEYGTGYVDVSVILSRALHVMELKILRGPFQGVEQLTVYMKQEKRREGWLVVFDAKAPNAKCPWDWFPTHDPIRSASRRRCPTGQRLGVRLCA
jgi:hypothetical protein